MSQFEVIQYELARSTCSSEPSLKPSLSSVQVPPDFLQLLERLFTIKLSELTNLYCCWHLDRLLTICSYRDTSILFFYLISNSVSSALMIFFKFSISRFFSQSLLFSSLLSLARGLRQSQSKYYFYIFGGFKVFLSFLEFPVLCSGKNFLLSQEFVPYSQKADEFWVFSQANFLKFFLPQANPPKATLAFYFQQSKILEDDLLFLAAIDWKETFFQLQMYLEPEPAIPNQAEPDAKPLRDPNKKPSLLDVDLRRSILRTPCVLLFWLPLILFINNYQLDNPELQISPRPHYPVTDFKANLPKWNQTFSSWADGKVPQPKRDLESNAPRSKVPQYKVIEFPASRARFGFNISYFNI